MPRMTASEAKHVFISYVQEDSAHVDRLCKVLEAAQIPYWRDRKSLGPGDAWKIKIRDAIRSGAAIFIACFSENSRLKTKSYMNEEITLAVEEFRKMPPGHTWLIPIRFDDTNIPEWDLGAGRTLYDLNYIDLFGDDRDEQLVTLAAKLLLAVGENKIDPATVSASVDEATIAERRVMLHRLTKEMLLEPSRTIEMNDLVSDEVGRIISAMRDTARFPIVLSHEDADQQLVRVASVAEDYRQLVEPFCSSLQVAARWAAAKDLTPWIDGLRAIYSEANKPLTGSTALIKLRKIPTLFAIFTVALTCTGQKRWENLNALLVDNTVSYSYREKKTPLLQANSPWEPFENSPDLVPNMLARSAKNGESLQDALSQFTQNNASMYHTPIAEWLFHTLRPAFNDQFRDDSTYETEFDKAEVILGLISQDIANVEAGENGGAFLRRSQWFGRVMWRFRRFGNPIDEIAEEKRSHGTAWQPLSEGLFDGDSARADRAISDYREILLQTHMF
jgi:hypothetical protein